MLSLPLFSCFLALHPYIFLNFFEFFSFSCILCIGVTLLKNVMHLNLRISDFKDRKVVHWKKSKDSGFLQSLFAPQTLIW